MREKYIILLVFATFGVVCFGAFFFLPDLRDRVSVPEMKKQIQIFGDDIFMPGGQKGASGQMRHMDNHGGDVDIHKVEDKAKLDMKIAEEFAKQKALKELSEKANLAKDDTLKFKEEIKEDKDKLIEQQRQREMEMKEEAEKKLKETVHKEHEGGDGTQGGEPSDPDVKQKRDKIKEVTINKNGTVIFSVNTY
jgi:mannosyl-oligosaccharide alpha-1,2-mannosidase